MLPLAKPHSPSSRWRLKPPVQGHLHVHRDTDALIDLFTSTQHLSAAASLGLAVTAFPVCRMREAAPGSRRRARALWMRRPGFDLAPPL